MLLPDTAGDRQERPKRVFAPQACQHRGHRNPARRRSPAHPSQLVEHLALVLTAALSGCTTFKPPQISYDDELPPPAELPKAADDHPRPLHVPPAWTPA